MFHLQHNDVMTNSTSNLKEMQQVTTEVTVQQRGMRLCRLFKPDSRRSNRIKTIESFCRQFPYIIFSILIKKHILYCLTITILNIIAISSLHVPVNSVLFLLLVAISLGKSISSIRNYESYDKRENTRKQCGELLLQNGQTAQKSWEKISVGSVVAVKPGEEFPADMVPLCWRETGSWELSLNDLTLCVDTCSLDRQCKNTRKVIPEQAKTLFISCYRYGVDVTIICEKPNKSFNNFRGQIDNIELTIDNFVLRGSRLVPTRHTANAQLICVAVYCGNQCKKMMNINRRRTYTESSLLIKKFETQIPVSLILATTIAIVWLSISLYRRETPNYAFFRKMAWELTTYLNLLHIWTFVLLQIARIGQFLRYRRSLDSQNLQLQKGITRHNQCQTLDQFGFSRILICDSLALFDRTKIIVGESVELKPAAQEIPGGLQFVRELLEKQFILDGLFEEQITFQEKKVAQNRLYSREIMYDLSGLNRKWELIAYRKFDSNTIYVFLKFNKQDLTTIKLLRVERKREPTSLLTSSVMSLSTEGRFLLISVANVPSDLYMKFEHLTTGIPYQIDLRELTRERLKFKEIGQLQYIYQGIQPADYSSFVTLTTRSNLQFWIVIGCSLKATEDLLVCSGLFSKNITKYVLDQEDNTERQNNLNYILAEMSKNVNTKSMLFISYLILDRICQKQRQLIRHISRQCSMVVCYRCSSYLRGELLKFFKDSQDGVVYLSQSTLSNPMLLSCDLSLTVKNESYVGSDARLFDIVVSQREDLPRLLTNTGPLCYRHNCQIIYCCVFLNSVFVGHHILLLLTKITVQPSHLQLLSSWQTALIVFFSLPLFYHSMYQRGDNYLGERLPNTRYSEWAVWRIAILGLFIGIASMMVGFGWLKELNLDCKPQYRQLASDKLLSMQFYSLTNGILTGNLFVGLMVLFENVPKIRKLITWLLILLDLSLYSLWLFVVKVSSKDLGPCIKKVFTNRDFLLSCLAVGGLIGLLPSLLYLKLRPLGNEEKRRKKISRNKDKEGEVKCRLMESSKEAIRILEESPRFINGR